jgi:hypothetical protein
MAPLRELQSMQNGKTLLFRADGTVAVKSGANAVTQGRWTANNTSSDPKKMPPNQIRYDLQGAAQPPIPIQQSFNANNQLVTTIAAANNGGTAASCTWFGSIEVDDLTDVVYHLMTDDQQDAKHQLVVYGELEVDDANADLTVNLTEGGKTSIKRAKVPNSIVTKPRDAASKKAPYQLQFSASTQNNFPGAAIPVPAPARIRFNGLWQMDPTRGFVFAAKASGTLAKPEVSIGFAGKFKGVEAGFQYTTADKKLVLTIAGQHTWDHGKGQFKFTLVNQGSALFQADFTGGFTHTTADGKTFTLDGTLSFKKQGKVTTFGLTLAGTYQFAADGRLTFSVNVGQAGGVTTYDIQLGGTVGFKGGTLTFSATLSNKQTSTIQVAFDSADLKAKFSIAFGKALNDTNFNLEFQKSWNMVEGKWVSGDPLALLGKT